MGFFKKPVLDKERVKALDQFRERAVKTLEELRKNTKIELEKTLFERMIRNVENTPIYFYPKKTLKERIFQARGRVFGSVIKGEHVNVIRIFQKGSQRFFLRSNYINMPAEHVFEGSKLTVEGIFTLAHEYAHFPKPSLNKFAKANGISNEQAEELLADTLSAKLAVGLGYPKEHVLKHFQGRELVYGSIPFKRLIWNAVNK
jgi:hypothetical protein